MKKVLLFSVCVMGMLCSFRTYDHFLAGHWISNDGAPGSKILVDFNVDGTFRVSVNGQTENEGSYKQDNDTLYMYDANCGIQTAGKYKLNFYTEDSVSFELIQDSCATRIQEVNGGTIARLREGEQ